MSIVSDAVLAATGVIAPVAPTPQLLAASSEIPPTFASKMRALLDRNEPHAFRPRMPKRTFRHYFDSLEGMLGPAEVSAILDGVGDEVLAAEYTEQLVTARALLVEAAPANGYTSLTGPIEIELNEYDKAEWWSVIMIAEDPEYVATELEQGTVSVEQVTTLRQVYPDLYGCFVTILNGAIADKRLAQPTFELHPDLEVTFRIFLGMPIDGVESPGAPAPAAAPSQPAAAKPIKLDQLLPPSGKTESRR